MTSFDRFIEWYDTHYPDGPLCEEAIDYFRKHYLEIDKGNRCPTVWCYSPKRDRQLAFKIQGEFEYDYKNR